jgi:hypothetical protein
MPENWSLPTTTSNYATGVIQAINNKFIDCITLFRGGDGSNLPTNAIRYNGDLAGTFQRWNGSVWANMILAVAGGGTGSDNPAGIRTNLGLGTMAVQNANAVDITGGNAVGMGNIVANNINGAILSSADGSGINKLDGSKITLGIVAPARLGSGLANASTFLRGDSIWAAPAGTLPSGLIAMFAVACPAGWTRVAAWDGRFVRGAAAYGATGGANTHTHTGGSFAVASHTHGPGSFQARAHSHNGHIDISISGRTNDEGWHQHNGYVGGGGTTGGENAGSMNVDAGNSGNMARAGHGHDFSWGNGFTVDGNGSHGHNFAGSQGKDYTTYEATPPIDGVSAAAAPGVSGSTDAASSLPPYIDAVFCMKD